MSDHLGIPPGLARTNIDLYGDAGVVWLDALPALLDEFAERWSLTLEPPFPNLSYNYAAPAIQRDGTPVVLKAGYPSRELRIEAEALQIYSGRGAVQLLDMDIARGVLLLEHLTPGTLLSYVQDDDTATRIAAGVMRQLWRPVPEEHSFPTVADWAKGMGRLRERFGGGSGPLPSRLVDMAERLFGDLLRSMDEPVLLHGDLHHYNILAATRQPWLAIDPKGIVGEREYEVGALLRNEVPDIIQGPELERLLQRRIAILSEELGFDRQRLRDWGLAQAVLSAWWTIEDSGGDGEDSGNDWGGAIEIAEALDRVIRDA